jgi:hypothetical protein
MAVNKRQWGGNDDHSSQSNVTILTLRNQIKPKETLVRKCLVREKLSRRVINPQISIIPLASHMCSEWYILLKPPCPHTYLAT